jgi:hypothetical protein
MRLPAMKKNSLICIFCFCLLLNSRSIAQQNSSIRSGWGADYSIVYAYNNYVSQFLGCRYQYDRYHLSFGFSHGYNLSSLYRPAYFENYYYEPNPHFFGAYIQPEMQVFKFGSRCLLNAKLFVNYSNRKSVSGWDYFNSSGKFISTTTSTSLNSIDFHAGLGLTYVFNNHFNAGFDLLARFYTKYYMHWENENLVTGEITNGSYQQGSFTTNSLLGDWLCPKIGFTYFFDSK